MSPALTQVSAPTENGEYHPHIKTAEEMDEERREHIAYEYLCRMEEAKKWIESFIQDKLPEVTAFEKTIRNGVVLAKLSAKFAPTVVSERKIFDANEARYEENGLHFRHTDNINYFLKALDFLGLPEIFKPETTDVYDGKNIPRVIYCLHALSLFLYKLGQGPAMLDLTGKATFTEEQISAMKSALNSYGLKNMPQFRMIGGILADELDVDEAEFHAAIMAINDALDHHDSGLTLKCLQNPNARLSDVDSDMIMGKKYHLVLKNSREEKMNNQPEILTEAYDTNLSQNEIQNHVDKINLLMALENVEVAVKTKDLSALQLALNSRYLNLDINIKSNLMPRYLKELEAKMGAVDFLRREDIYAIVSRINVNHSSSNLRETALKQVNQALEVKNVKSLVKALKASCYMKPPMK